MNKTLFAVALSLVFAAVSFAQEDTQQSASDNLADENIVAPVSLAPGAFDSADMVEKVVEGNASTMDQLPANQSVLMDSSYTPVETGVIQSSPLVTVPFNCYNGQMVMPATYQQSMSSPIWQYSQTPTPVASPSIAAGGIIQSATPSISGQLNTMTPATTPMNQSTPFIQPNSVNNQIIGNQVSRPMLVNSINPVFETAGSSQPAANSQFSYPASNMNWIPSSSSNYGNCCPQTRSYGFGGGRLFRRFR